MLENESNFEILRRAVIAALTVDIVSREEYNQVVEALEEARANARYFEQKYYKYCGLGLE